MSRRKRSRGNVPPKNSPNRQHFGNQGSDSNSAESPEDSQPEKIADIPALKRDVSAVLNGAETIKAVVTLLKDEGVDHKVLDELLLGTEEILQYGNIGEVADEFNAAFGKHGWIATESFSVKIMLRALRQNEERGLRAAEPVIMSWFGDDTIRRFAVDRYDALGKFRLRTRQLNEALQWTMEKYYTSAVPLILIACDGFARDFLSTELFSPDADISLDNSFVGHNSALLEFISQFTVKVSETSNDSTNDPVRHGIMHGRTLNYANPTVCMKAWLLFIALTDLYIEKKEQEKASAETLETLPEPTMEGLVKSFLARGQELARSRPVDMKQMYAQALAQAIRSSH